MRQDYVFLIDYSRVLALAVAKADDLETMGRFAELLHETLNTEMDLHRGFAAKLGISTAELEDTDATPGTRAYTQHLLATAYGGDLADITAAILPCMWDYSDIGQTLAVTGALHRRNRFLTSGFRCTRPPSSPPSPPGCGTSWTAWEAEREPTDKPVSAGCSRIAAVMNIYSGTWRTGRKPGRCRWEERCVTPRFAELVGSHQAALDDLRPLQHVRQIILA